MSLRGAVRKGLQNLKLAKIVALIKNYFKNFLHILLNTVATHPLKNLS